MTGTYTRYTVEDADGDEQMIIYEEKDYAEARDHAQEIGGVCIANEYEWQDSEIIDDFRTQSEEEDDAP